MHLWYELSRKACGWLVRGGIAAVGNSSMGSDPMDEDVDSV